MGSYGCVTGVMGGLGGSQVTLEGLTLTWGIAGGLGGSRWRVVLRALMWPWGVDMGCYRWPWGVVGGHRVPDFYNASCVFGKNFFYGKPINCKL